VTPGQIISSAGGKVDYANDIFRFVETQEEAGSYFLVDDLEEQSILESVVDNFKPSAPNYGHHYHYLITTPFRYPPLKHGSRFGSRAENSYFYASEKILTCLAESAFYRFAFFDGMTPQYQHKVRSNHQLFNVGTKTVNALDLTTITDTLVNQSLSSKTSYMLPQQVGAQARKDGFELIRFNSAREKNGVNVAIDNINVITSIMPDNITAVKCETLAMEGIIRMSLPKSFPITFTRDQFLIDGQFPYPPA
jgi:hypothetical protein